MAIAVIDYGMGNIKSVTNALEILGSDYQIIKDFSKLKNARAIILPGVGAFAQGMKNLKKQKLLAPLNELVVKKKMPYLGICLGLQFLAEKSLEHGKHQGFGWLKGTVVSIKTANLKLKVPHMGWNDLEIKPGSKLFRNIENHSNFYFVHSYHFQPTAPEEEVITASCDYGTKITASVEKNNIYGVQFHPEKSQSAGLKVLSNFVNLIG